MLTLTLVPTLALQRDIAAMPPGRERFRSYLRTLTGGTDAMVLPLTLMNPMGKPHVLARIDELIALDAEGVAARAIERARDRQTDLADTIDVALVVVDDAQGGWTNRYFTDYAHRFEDRYAIARGWATAALWTSEQPSTEAVEREVLASVFRSAYIRKNGHATSLSAMMRQEGLAAKFAGVSPTLDTSAVARARDIIAPHREAARHAAIFACLYGDDAATAAGYSALGLPPYAALEVALAEVRTEVR